MRTGQLRWIFHAVPQGTEFGVDTWEDESWQSTGNTNVWTVMSCDEALGMSICPSRRRPTIIMGGNAGATTSLPTAWSRSRRRPELGSGTSSWCIMVYGIMTYPPRRIWPTSRSRGAP